MVWLIFEGVHFQENQNSTACFFNTQVWLAFAGVLCIGLAIGITYGLSSAFQLFVSPVHSVLPFLLLGKLVTDSFASAIFFIICDALHDLVPFIQLKNVKNTHGGVLLLVKFQLKPVALLKETLFRRYFSRFLNSTNGTKLSKTSHILELFKVLADD